MYLIESQQDIDLTKLGSIVLEALEDLNRDRGTDFETHPVDPRVIKSTADYEEWIVGSFRHDFDKGLGMHLTSDSVVASRMKSLRGIFSGDLALSLLWQGIKPSWVVTPGFGETCPVDQSGMFYMNPTIAGRFSAYLVGRNIQKKVSGVDRTWHFYFDSRGKPQVTSIN